MSNGYLTQQGVANLATYAYSGVDKSLIVFYVMKHFWNWLVEFVPTWVAPNVLTLMGLTCMSTGFSIVVSNCETISYCREFPTWGYPAIAFLIFCYQTLDNLDGKQARRTGSSSALGEVFDHGGDSLTVPMFTIILSNALQFGSTASFILLIYLTFVFSFVHWEGYFTGTVVLDTLANPTEAQFSLIGLLLITWAYGNQFWLNKFNLPLLGETQLNHIILGISCLIAFQGFLTQLSKIRLAAHQKGIPTRSVVLFLLPLTSVFVIAGLWVYISPETLENWPKLFICTFGWLAAYVEIRQIVHNVCKEPYKLYYNVQTPALLALVLIIFGKMTAPILDDSFILKGVLAVVIGNIAVAATSLIQEFCVALDIWAFSIKPKPVPGVV